MLELTVAYTKVILIGVAGRIKLKHDTTQVENSAKKLWHHFLGVVKNQNCWFKKTLPFTYNEFLMISDIT